MYYPLISIIVPIYNVQDYLDKCISSIVNQTYSNIEIILVDDGSTDSSSLICDKYKKTDDRIKVVHKENGGLSSARNAGLDICKGKFIAFIDSDDYVAPSFIEVLHSNLVKNDAEICCCSVSNFQNIFIYHFDNRCLTPIQYLENINFISQCVWNKLYKSSLLKGVRFPINKLAEDAFVIYDIIARANKIVNLNDALYFYNSKNPSSITNSKSYELHNDILESKLHQIKLLINKKYPQHILHIHYNDLILWYYDNVFWSRP